jgi:signal transduction histidine kinase
MSLLRLGFVFLSLFAPLAAQEAFQGNEKDDHTIHLWHLDESGVPFLNAFRGEQDWQGLHNGATAGHASLAGLGNCVCFNHFTGGKIGEETLRGAILLAAPELSGAVDGEGGESDNVSGFTLVGLGGAFTIDLICKLEKQPKAADGEQLALITMDGDVPKDRFWMFNITKRGKLSFQRLDAEEKFEVSVDLPTSGPNAVELGAWYHAAVVYSGKRNVAGNVKLYWTRIQQDLRQANLVGEGRMTKPMPNGQGDLALGNEARSYIRHNAEAQPFPGYIDEVRISRVARHASDFFFVRPEYRLSPDRVEAVNTPPTFKIELASIRADDRVWDAAALREMNSLTLPSGASQLDFAFRIQDFNQYENSKLVCKLDGAEVVWRLPTPGMMLEAEFFNDKAESVGLYRHGVSGTTDNWEPNLSEIRLTLHREPIDVPPTAKTVTITLHSGPEDTIGQWLVERMTLGSPRVSPPVSVNGWMANETSHNAIAVQLNQPAASPHRRLALLDGSGTRSGWWKTSLPLPPEDISQEVTQLSWYQAYSVIGGSTRQATYVNVPPGDYTFRVLGSAGSEETPSVGNHAFAIRVPAPFWLRPWFAPAAAALVVGLASALVLLRIQQRGRLSLEKARFQTALEKDRTRIARDMHDDLGARATVINMTAALAGQSLTKSPEKTPQHLKKMQDITRNLVVAMDSLVWAVDPAYDTLDALGTHFTRLAEELYHDSDMRCRLDIPSVLPHLSIRSEFRHHLSLAVKEALHNSLQHSGGTEVSFQLTFDEPTRQLTMVIVDNGKGFDPKNLPNPNKTSGGVKNLPQRMAELGGSCVFASANPGTVVRLTCRIPS